MTTLNSIRHMSDEELSNHKFNDLQLSSDAELKAIYNERTSRDNQKMANDMRAMTASMKKWTIIIGIVTVLNFIVFTYSVFKK
jgi:hypothetical protein